MNPRDEQIEVGSLVVYRTNHRHVGVVIAVINKKRGPQYSIYWNTSGITRTDTWFSHELTVLA